MSEKIIKSADRVKDIGEVFTPKKTVDFMLDQPEIKEKVNSLTATFLEPSAGEGAFLTEILHRKLLVAQKQSNSARKFGENCLIALSSRRILFENDATSFLFDIGGNRMVGMVY